jgi:sulfite dehydrogenase (cytochrome) subunit B
MTSVPFSAAAIAIVGLSVAFTINAADSRFQLPAETAKFKAGAGAELAVSNCLLCHSADYVFTQPPLDRAAWQGIVVKMREKYGAPLPPDKVDAVVDYLAKTYGKEKAPKPRTPP